MIGVVYFSTTAGPWDMTEPWDITEPKIEPMSILLVQDHLVFEEDINNP